MPLLDYQAIILAGGECKRLYPLTSGSVKALLPVANKPLLSYPLKALSDAGVRNALVVVSGESASARVASWLNTSYHGQQHGSVHCEVVTVPEGSGTADALRIAADKISAEACLVISGDLLTDVPLHALVAKHQLTSALATVLLGQTKASPTTTTKPGKAPKGVDYVGLDSRQERLLFHATSADTLRDLKLPMAVLRKFGSIDIRTDLYDAFLYVFSRAALALLKEQPGCSSLSQNFLPALARHQLRRRHAADGSGWETGSSAQQAQDDDDAQSEATSSAAGLPGADYLELSHSNGSASAGSGGGRPAYGGHVAVHVVAKGQYCARVHSLQTYTEVNREVAASDVALHLTGLEPSKYDNIVPPSTTFGAKSTVGNACIVGENGTLGDKVSVKRSVIGNNAKVGTASKIVNSVLLDNVTLGEGVHLQNSVLCAGATIGDRVVLKDCQVGPGFVVSSGDHNGEVLAKQ